MSFSLLARVLGPLDTPPGASKHSKNEGFEQHQGQICETFVKSAQKVKPNEAKHSILSSGPSGEHLGATLEPIWSNFRPPGSKFIAFGVKFSGATRNATQRNTQPNTQRKATQHEVPRNGTQRNTQRNTQRKATQHEAQRNGTQRNTQRNTQLYTVKTEVLHTTLENTVRNHCSKLLSRPL